jgi:hypothetical protein
VRKLTGEQGGGGSHEWAGADLRSPFSPQNSPPAPNTQKYIALILRQRCEKQAATATIILTSIPHRLQHLTL